MLNSPAQRHATDVLPPDDGVTGLLNRKSSSTCHLVGLAHRRDTIEWPAEISPPATTPPDPGVGDLLTQLPAFADITRPQAL